MTINKNHPQTKKAFTFSQRCLRVVKRTERMRSLGLAALQQLRKALLLAHGSDMLIIEPGDLPLHRVHSGRPRLLKESLCWLEHLESSHGRREHGGILLLLLLLLLLLRFRLRRGR